MTDEAIVRAERLKQLSERELNYKENPEQWSILECFEHLNRYGDYYLPEIEKSILQNKSKGSVPPFRSGVIGNWFANLMKVKNGKIVKMKTPGDKIPPAQRSPSLPLTNF